MKIKVDFNMFAECFKVRGLGNFSYNGLKALFEYFEKLEAETGEEIELYPIGFCCDWTEYANITEAASEYGIRGARGLVAGVLRNKTEVIEFDGGVIVKNF